jgi:1A family penicillin-binding protein
VGTGFAARQFLTAVARDAVTLARRMRLPPVRVTSVAKYAVIGMTAIMLAAVSAMLWVLHTIPLDLRSPHDEPTILVEAADGQPIGRVGAMGDAVPREGFPDVLVQAVLSIEDRRFYGHWGVDLRGIARAIYANWSAGGVVEGGSTITQQLAKNQLVGNDRNLTRKFREAFFAFWMETRLSKDEILTRYLNSVYLGAGMQGMSAAARHYFDKDLKAITLPEAAMLAGLIQAPSRYNPIANPDRAARRTGVVLDAMAEAKTIDASQAAAAKAKPAVLRVSSRTAPATSWFADWIAKHEFGKLAGTTTRPMRLRTTLDRKVQAVAERVVNDALSQLGAKLAATQAALVAMRPDGSVVAMVGGRDYGESQFNRAVDARRQPGSAFKLFVYYAALRNGYAPDDIIDASPVELKGWKPENYGGQRYGNLTLADSFAHSVNSAAIRLGLNVGLDKVVDAARELGLSAQLAAVPSMALGTNEVTLLDLTTAFASIRAGRAKLEPWGIAAFGTEGAGIRSLSAPSGPAEQSLPYRREMTELLRRVVDSGTGRGAALENGLAAGKTGTSQDYRDAWFIGFSEDIVVGVWVGNDDHTPMKGVTGGALPASIWQKFVTGATPLLARPRDTPEVRQDTPEAAPEVAVNEPALAQCDIQACSSAYSSFKASDCTYQPYFGPRRICEWGAPRRMTVSHAENRDVSPAGSCNAALCSRQFRSFDPATCTYQPHGGGPREVCTMRGSE